MFRNPLLELLRQHRTSAHVSSAELPSLERIEQFVARAPRCFERALEEGHVTGSAWVLDHEAERCLLTHHKKLKIWIQPGGHADGDPDILQVALREATEESGIPGLLPLSTRIFDVDVHAIPATPKEPAHFHYDVRFALIAPKGAQYVVSDESNELAWVGRGEISRYSSEASLLRMAEKWRI